MAKPVNIAYYEKKDWDYFLSVIADRHSMHKSWDDWYEAYSKLKANLISQGFFVREIKVDINELIDYCIDKKILNDGKARSQFVMTK